MRPNASGITTSPKALPSRTGTRVGAHGSAMLDASRHLAERLAARSPSEVDSRLVSSALQCGVVLKEGYEPRYQQVVMTATAGSLDDIEAARVKFGHAMTPPTRDQAEAWLAELSVITARRQDDEQTEALRLAAYASRLSDYPADVARHALLGKRWRFFPAWADLAEACDEMMVQRRRMMRALDEAAEQQREAEIRARALPTASSAVKTPEEAAAQRAEVDSWIAKLRDGAQMEAASAARERDALHAALRASQRPDAGVPAAEGEK